MKTDNDAVRIEGGSAFERYEARAAAFYRATGMMAPGKDQPAAMGGPSYEAREAAWLDWLAETGRLGICAWDITSEQLSPTPETGTK